MSGLVQSARYMSDPTARLYGSPVAANFATSESDARVSLSSAGNGVVAGQQFVIPKRARIDVIIAGWLMQ